MQNTRNIHGVWGLLAGILGSAVGTTLMRHSRFGLSAFYSVSLSLYHASGCFTMGAWNTIFQVGLVVLLIILLRRWRWSYALSFLVVQASSILIDGCDLLFARLPQSLFWRLCWYLLGLAILSWGIAFLARCKLPVMPMNLFVREISEVWEIPFRRVKVWFDVGCLLFSVAVSLFFAGTLNGVGWGTVAAVLVTGRLTGIWIEWLDRHVGFYVR